MEKIRIKDLVKFRRKSERSRITIAKNLKLEKKSDSANSSGGDYWISCLSAISNAFKDDNLELLDNKMILLNDKIIANDDKRIKDQFQRNFDVLYNFKEFDFKEIKPNEEFVFQQKQKVKSILQINELPIQAKPDHVFTFSRNERDEVGAVWFIAQLNGFDKGELGMFVDILYRYLITHYSEDFFVNASYCFAIDVNKVQSVSYKDIEEGTVPKLLDKTIENLKKLL